MYFAFLIVIFGFFKRYSVQILMTAHLSFPFGEMEEVEKDLWNLWTYEKKFLHLCFLSISLLLFEFIY